MSDPLALAIAAAGGSTKLAHKLTAAGCPITPNGVHSWALVPRSRLRAVSKVTRIAQKVLRPDLSRGDFR